MRFKRRFKSHVRLENIALTDIIMNLFLFFVISFGLTASIASKHTSPLKVSLPTVASGPTSGAEIAHEIFLTKSGDILWNKTKISSVELNERLADKSNRDSVITLNADKDASVQMLVSLLEVVRNSGAQNVSLRTELKPGKN